MGKSVSEIHAKSLEKEKYKTFFKSLGAFCIDMALISLILVISVFFFGSMDSKLGALVRFAIPFIPIIYIIASQFQMQNTPGRESVSITIVDSESENNISIKQTCSREILHLLSILLVFLSPLLVSGWVFDSLWSVGEGVSIEWIISVLMLTLPLYVFWSLVEIVSMAMMPRNRSIQDLIAKTITVRHY
ncbi:RDD family protein [Glaciecola sp. MH2013]|uniref:RDD family protein n=1 Tax=Glaciecola sp. MH2013 TaxID=2785524 RepID=UPI00189D7DB0|nr:RDD family protein [Glaciecola sp. MH2013]MBF7074084.1 RDD family protein [Glaciecola sp. MH2013]